MNKFIMFSCLFMFLMVTSSQANPEERKLYIVYMGAVSSNSDYATTQHHHHSLLRSVTGKGYKPSLIVTHYGNILDGFTAWLTGEERKKLEVMSDVVSVFPSLKLKLHEDVNVIKDDVIESGLRTQHLAPM